MHWNLNHFVVLKKVARNHIVILDPAVGERRLKLDEVSRSFTGVALELTPNADFEATDQRKKVALSALTGKVLGLKRSLFQIFGIALALQLFAIASPLLNQLVVDDAIATYDKDLHTGRITSVSDTPFAANELPPNLAQQLMAQNGSAEALYRINVQLDAQSITSYGQPIQLKPGLTLEADVLQERREVWEWALEPLLAARANAKVLSSTK